MMNIRQAILEDIDSLLAIDDFAKENEGRKELIHRYVQSSQCWVAEIDNTLVGYIIHVQDFFEYDFVKLVIIANNYRRLGVAKALIKHVLASVYPNKLFISCNLSNLAAQALFVACGFERCGVVTEINTRDPEIFYVNTNS